MMALVNGTSHNNGVCHNEEDINNFLQSVFNMVMEDVLKKRNDKNEPVVQFKKPAELKKLLNLKIQDEGLSHEELLSQCSKFLKYSVKTGNIRFFNQLYAGVDPYGFAGQVVTDALNASVYTYEVAPVFTLMEKNILNHVCTKMIGWEDGDGTFSPGGSYSNMLGMNLARFHKFPEVKEKGMHGLPQLVGFVSSHSHYSSRKNASLLGLGSDNLINIQCDDAGRMIPAELERHVTEAKHKNLVPFLVVATSGTTVLGAFDPINPIADICQKHGIWLHVDAAWGGGVLLSKKHKYLCSGIERSDSVAWNPHKQAMAPQQCCIFVTKHLGIMNDCHNAVVPYLFQQDKKSYDPSYDLGNKIVQCGRKVDSMKLWMMWTALGTKGLERRIDRAFDNARYLADVVKKTEGFKLILEPECTNVCFWFLPKRMRSLKWDLKDQDFFRKLAQVAPTIKAKMTEKGSMLVGYQPIGNFPNFFRMIVINELVTHSDMDFVVDEIKTLGENL